ncbi:hypothetical protein D918_03501 [Trichuris suis]|nr:hypothetical protein D918_03501 [Trichuris suis]
MEASLRASYSVPKGEPCRYNSVMTDKKLNWLLTEERKLMELGMDAANRLLNWYYERLSCLEKRQRLIGKSCFPADLAFHEEKLILLQERIEQLNCFIQCIVESSEKVVAHISDACIPQQGAPNGLNRERSLKGNITHRYSLNQSDTSLLYEDGVQATLM